MLTYKTTHKEQLKTQALSTRWSSSGVEERLIENNKREGSKEEDRQEVEVKQC